MKPASGQFRIEYQNGHDYEPDFVVETTETCLLIEPKRADQITQDDVQAKARAALRWCGYAIAHATEHGGKLWHYLLVPDTAIQLGRSVGLQTEFEWRSRSRIKLTLDLRNLADTASTKQQVEKSPLPVSRRGLFTGFPLTRE